MRDDVKFGVFFEQNGSLYGTSSLCGLCEQEASRQHLNGFGLE
jgi:hypothetical protein